MMDVVKIRRSGNSAIITLPRSIVKAASLEDGERVVLDMSLSKPGTITITKESVWQQLKR